MWRSLITFPSQNKLKSQIIIEGKYIETKENKYEKMFNIMDFRNVAVRSKKLNILRISSWYGARGLARIWRQPPKLQVAGSNPAAPAG